MEGRKIDSEMESETQPLRLDSIRSRIGELSHFLAHNNNTTTTSHLHFLLPLQTKLNQIVDHHTPLADSFHHQHLDAFMDCLTLELREMDAESVSVNKEIENLTKSYNEGVCKLEYNLESLRHAIDFVEAKGVAKVGGHVDDLQGHSKVHGDHYFEAFNLKHKIEKNEVTLKSLEDLHINRKRIEAIEKIEEALTGLKVIDFEDNSIRVSLKTYIPYFEGLMCKQIAENAIQPSEVKHELLIEIADGTLDLKNVEVFPNDVYIGEIVEAANSFRKLFSMLSMPESRSSLGWFLQKVQERIVICTMRQLMVKRANESRHSFVYVDKDELIVVHIIGGIDAFIKPSQGWPLSPSQLKLVSLKSSGQNAEEISLSLLCKIEEEANSLDFDIRKSLTNFVDGIEQIRLGKMRSTLHSTNILL